jgi:hypothetical protein
LRGYENLFTGLGQVQAQLDWAIDFHRRGALHSDSDLADVEDLVQIEHRALRSAAESGISGHVHFMAHATTTI